MENYPTRMVCLVSSCLPRGFVCAVVALTGLYIYSFLCYGWNPLGQLLSPFPLTTRGLENEGSCCLLQDMFCPGFIFLRSS